MINKEVLSYPFFFLKLSSCGLKDQLLAFFPPNVRQTFTVFSVSKNCWSKWDFPESCVCREALKVVLTCCQASASLRGRLGLLTGLSCDHDFFPLLLLSNFSLSLGSDLLLLFLVQPPVFFSQVSQKSSRKHLLWSSLEITCLKSGRLRVCWSSWKWWSWQGIKTEVRWGESCYLELRKICYRSVIFKHISVFPLWGDDETILCGSRLEI